MASLDTTQLLARLVAFDTTSRTSNLPLIAFVQDYLDGHGIASRLVHDESGEKANLWATIGEAEAPGLVLSGHTDVVPVDGQAWTSDPFALTARDDRLLARGACDMKGFIAAALAAVPAFKAAPLKRPIHLALSYDEEVGCVGVVRLLDVLRAEGVRPGFCIVGEPTSMNVVVGHKAKRSMRVTVRGRSCHSALTPQGVNAVEYAAMLAVRLREMGLRLEREGAHDPMYDPPHGTAHTGVMHGGTALNIVPDRCTMACEFRPLPGEDADALVAEFSAFADELAARMRQTAPEAGIDIDVYAGFPGIETAPGAEITRLAQGWAGSETLAKVAFGTEAGRFHEALGVPAVVCGPGDIAVAHKPDEYVERGQLALADRFMRRLADWACG
jgi:acetylornithine deacetylase